MPRKRTQLSRQTATAKRLRVLRSNETEDENMHRLATQRAITEQNRARESSVERSQRLASQNFRTLANRQRESSADRSQRLASQNARTLANRDRESSAERSQRLASQNSRTLANRDREQSAERSQRLTQQNARSTRNRTRRQHNLLNAAFAYDYQDITLELLVEANDHELSQIVPKIKDKIKIRSALDKLQVSSDAKESVSVSLPFRQNATIDFLSDEANGTQSQEWTIPLDSSDLEILNDFKTFQGTERGKSVVLNICWKGSSC
ncbi:hypothetical protein ACJJTC_003251 [Scirpophaga incertulas]